MSKEDVIKLDGTVVEVLRNTTYRIQVENFPNLVLGTLSGKMRQANIKVVIGDGVTIEFSPYDLSRGRIVRRL